MKKKTVQSLEEMREKELYVYRNTFFLFRKTQMKLELVRTHHTLQINLLIVRFRVICILHIENCI